MGRGAAVYLAAVLVAALGAALAPGGGHGAASVAPEVFGGPRAAWLVEALAPLGVVWVIAGVVRAPVSGLSALVMAGPLAVSGLVGVIVLSLAAAPLGVLVRAGLQALGVAWWSGQGAELGALPFVLPLAVGGWLTMLAGPWGPSTLEARFPAPPRRSWTPAPRPWLGLLGIGAPPEAESEPRQPEVPLSARLTFPPPAPPAPPAPHSPGEAPGSTPQDREEPATRSELTGRLRRRFPV
jgi:hypothetical protein